MISKEWFNAVLGPILVAGVIGLGVWVGNVHASLAAYQVEIRGHDQRLTRIEQKIDRILQRMERDNGRLSGDGMDGG